MAGQMMDPAAGAADPAATAVAQDGALDTSGGYCIEVRVDADGKIKVGVESLADEQAEDAQGGEPAAEGDDNDNEQYQEVGSIGEALKLVKQIYAGAGEMQDMGAGMDEMSAGYGVKKAI